MKTFTISERARKGIEISFTKGGDNRLFGIPIGQGLMKPFEDSGLQEATVIVDNCDFDDNVTRVLREQHWRDNRALCLVETSSGPGGEVKLYANIPAERIEGGRVRRLARPIEEAVGVEVIADRDTDMGKEYLVSLLPGASFKICRTGKLMGAPAELVVLWKGRWEYDRDIQAAEAGATQEERMKFWYLDVYPRNHRHAEM